VRCEKTICVGEFASEGRGFSARRIAGKKFEVSVTGHFLRFRQVRDKAPDLGEGHIVQAVIVSKLESG